jgi:hypothetical protein
MPRATVSGSSNFREELERFPGTSFLTSESKPDSSGKSTGTDLPQPAPAAESPFVPPLPVSPEVPSSVSTTDGSTQGTGPDQASLLDYSEVSPEEEEPSPVRASSFTRSSRKSSKLRAARPQLNK